MSFNVTILGSGSALPTSRRMPTSQYVVCANRHFLIDCGEGTQLQLRKLGIKFQRIDRIFISHLHGDHYFGLFGLLSTLHLLGRVNKLMLYAPSPLKSILEQILEAGNGKFSYEIEFVPLDNKVGEVLFEDDKVRIECIPLNHKIETYGFVFRQKKRDRVLLPEKAKEFNVPSAYFNKLKKGNDVETDDGRIFRSSEFTAEGEPERSYAYCSDTAYSAALVPYIRNVDVLYHEATFLEELKERAKQTKHSTAFDAATIAFEAQVGHLLMGHLSARYDDGKQHMQEALTVFPHAEVVEDGTTYQIPITHK